MAEKVIGERDSYATLILVKVGRHDPNAGHTAPPALLAYRVHAGHFPRCWSLDGNAYTGNSASLSLA